jgi:hypothetical protein
MAKKAHVLVKKDGLEVRIVTSISEICRIMGVAASTYYAQVKKKGFFENKEYVVRGDVTIEKINRNSPNIRIINDMIRDERKKAGKVISNSGESANDGYDY